MEPLHVPAGAKMMLGAPAEPMPKSRSDAIARVVAAAEGVLEAHLPQCFVPDTMAAAAQVLVVVLDSDRDPAAVLDRMADGLRSVIPEGVHLDVLPVPSEGPLLDAVRATGCEIYNSSPSNSDEARGEPWWKFW